MGVPSPSGLGESSRAVGVVSASCWLSAVLMCSRHAGDDGVLRTRTGEGVAAKGGWYLAATFEVATASVAASVVASETAERELVFCVETAAVAETVQELDAATVVAKCVAASAWLTCVDDSIWKVVAVAVVATGSQRERVSKQFESISARVCTAPRRTLDASTPRALLPSAANAGCTALPSHQASSCSVVEQVMPCAATQSDELLLAQPASPLSTPGVLSRRLL